MTLAELFSDTNIRILTLLKKDEHHIREIAEILHISPSKAHQAVKLFQQHGLVEIRKKRNMIIASINLESLLLDQLFELIDTYNYINQPKYDITKEVKDEERGNLPQS